MMRDGGPAPSRLGAAARSLRLGLMGALYLCAKKVESSTFVTIVGLVIRFAQLLSFTLTTDPIAANYRRTADPIKVASSLTTPRRFLPWLTPVVHVALYFGSVAWVALLLLLTANAMYAFIMNKFSFLLPFKALRLMGQLSTSVLFIPLVSMLLSPFECTTGKDAWTRAGYACNTGGFVAMQAVSVVLVVLLFGLCALFALAFYDSNPLSRQLIAKAHGRAEVVFLVIQVLLVLVGSVFNNMINSWVIVAVMIGCGIVYLASLTFFMPWYRHAMNTANICIAVCFLYSAICVIFLEIPGYETDAALMAMVGMPLAVLSGFAISNMRATSIIKMPAVRINSVYEIELKCRYMLHQALWGHPTDRLVSGNGSLMGSSAWQADAHADAHAPPPAASSSHPSGWASTAVRAGATLANAGIPPSLSRKSSSSMLGASASAAHIGSTMRSHHGADGAGAAAGSGAGHHSGAAGGLPRLQSFAGRTTDKHAAPGGMPGSGAAPTAAGAGGSPNGMDDFIGDDAESRDAAVRSRISPAVLAEVHDIYRAATARFRQSSILHVFFARLYCHYMGNRHMQMSHLLQAERRKPSLDVSFTVFANRKQAESESSGTGAMSAINRVTFEKYAADARRYVMKASMRQVAFWAELALAPLPDLGRLHRLSSEMNSAIDQAERAFAELFIINPQSLVIMRLYAAFNLLVTCNVEKANVLLAEADRIEDQKSKDHRSEGSGGSLAILQESSLDVNADNTAVLCVGGSLRNLGTIMSVNSSCCKVFGFSKLQLERRSVFTLIPPPLDDHLESELRQYVCTGEGRLVDFTRVVFGLHKNGFLLPLLMCVRETPPDEGASTFIILLRELRTDDQHILMTQDFTIVGCSAGSLAMLNVDANALRSNEVRITDFVEDWSDLVVELQTQRSTTVRIDTGAVAHGGAALGIDVQLSSYRQPSRNDGGGRSPTHASRLTHASSSADYFATGRRSGAGGSQPVRTDDAAASDDDEDDDDARSDAVVEGEVVDDDEEDGGRPSHPPRPPAVATASASHTWIRGNLQRLDLPSGQVLWVLHWQRLASTDMLSIAKANARRQITQPTPAGAAAHVHALTATVASAFQATELTPPSITPARGGLSGTGLASQRAGGGGHGFAPTPTYAARGGAPLPVADGRSAPVATVSHRSDPGTPFMRGSPWAPLQPTALPGESIAAATAGAADPLAELVTDGVGAAAGASRPSRVPSVLSPARSQGPSSGTRPRRGSATAALLEVPTSPAAGDATLKKIRRPALKSPGPVSPATRGEHTVRLGSGADGDTVAHRSEFGGDKSQSSTGTSTSKMLTRLRRAFALRDQQPLLPGLWYLRLVGLLVTLLAIGLSVGIVAATVASFNSYADNVSYVTMGSERVVSTFSAMIAMFDTLHIAKGWEEGTLDDLINLPAYILGNTSAYLALHRAMYTRAQQLPTAMHQYTRTIVTTIEFDQAGSGYYGTDAVMNLFEAGVQLAKHFGQVAATPVANLSSDLQPDVRYLMTNGLPLGNTHELLQISSDAGYTLSVESAASVKQTQIIVYGCMIALLAILSLGVFLPILINIERAKDAIVLRFLELPAVVKKALHAQAQRRFRTLRSQYVTDEDEDDALDSDVDSDEERANTTGIIDQLQDGEGGSDAGDADVDWRGLMRTLGGTRDSLPASQRRAVTPQSASRKPATQSASAGGGARRQQRRSSISSPSSLASIAPQDVGYQKSAWSFLRLLAQFIGPLVALALFFSCVFGAAVVYLSRTSVLVAVSTSATARATCSREVVVDVLKMLMTHGEHETTLIDFDTLKDSRDCVSYWQRLLQFGSEGVTEEERGPSASATPVVETGSFWLFDQSMNDGIYNLLFSNACPYLQTLANGRFDTTRCEAFGGGILKQGLVATVSEFARRATVIGDRRVRTKLIQNDTMMNGYIVHARCYNYTADQQCFSDWCTRPEFSFDVDRPLPRPRLPTEDFIGDVPAGWPDAPPDTTPYRVADELSSADMEFIREADAFYVTPALFDLAARYSAIASDTIVSCQQFLVVFVGAFAGSFVLYMLMWPAQIRRTHMDILAKRAIILYISPEVVVHVKSIRRLVQQILAADSDTVIADSRPPRSSGGGSLARVAPSDGDSASAAQRMSDGGVLSGARSFHGIDSLSPSNRA